MDIVEAGLARFQILRARILPADLTGNDNAYRDRCPLPCKALVEPEHQPDMGTGNRAIEQRAVLSARVEVVRHDGDDTAAGLTGSERSGEMAVSGERVHGAGRLASDRERKSGGEGKRV